MKHKCSPSSLIQSSLMNSLSPGKAWSNPLLNCTCMLSFTRCIWEIKVTPKHRPQPFFSQRDEQPLLLPVRMENTGTEWEEPGNEWCTCLPHPPKNQRHTTGGASSWESGLHTDSVTEPRRAICPQSTSDMRGLIFWEGNKISEISMCVE